MVHEFKQYDDGIWRCIYCSAEPKCVKKPEEKRKKPEEARARKVPHLDQPTPKASGVKEKEL